MHAVQDLNLVDALLTALRDRNDQANPPHLSLIKAAHLLPDHPPGAVCQVSQINGI